MHEDWCLRASCLLNTCSAGSDCIKQETCRQSLRIRSFLGAMKKRWKPLGCQMVRRTSLKGSTLSTTSMSNEKWSTSALRFCFSKLCTYWLNHYSMSGNGFQCLWHPSCTCDPSVICIFCCRQGHGQICCNGNLGRSRTYAQHPLLAIACLQHCLYESFVPTHPDQNRMKLPLQSPIQHLQGTSENSGIAC